MDDDASQVGFRAKVRIADYIEIREAGEAKGLTDAAAACRFEVDDGVGGVARMMMKLQAKKERPHQRSLILATRLQAVGAVVRGMKGAVCLKNDIGLASNVTRNALRMGEHGGRRIGLRRSIRQKRLWSRLGGRKIPFLRVSPQRKSQQQKCSD